jgi:hypothetical protein
MQLGSQARKISQDAEIEEVTLFSTTLVAAWERKLVHIKGRWVLSCYRRRRIQGAGQGAGKVLSRNPRA